MGGPLCLSDREVLWLSARVKQDCKLVLLLFLPLCQVASSFNNLTRLHYRYVLLPAPALVLCSILQKPGARSPLISKMFYRATLQAAISCITS